MELGKMEDTIRLEADLFGFETFRTLFGCYAVAMHPLREAVSRHLTTLDWDTHFLLDL
jgi:hypothetical protein